MSPQARPGWSASDPLEGRGGITIIEAGPEPARVLVAGAGAAGLETMLALHELAGSRTRVELLAPEREFHYRPLTVAEPFGLVEPRALDLNVIADEFGATLRTDALASVDPAGHCVMTAGGSEVGYDIVVIAVGARPLEAVEGALTFTGGRDGAAFARLLDDLERGTVKRVAFAVPSAVAWSLPVYELALMTADRLRRRGVHGAELTVVTHEERPLAYFGDRVSGQVAERLRGADVALLASRAAQRFDHGELFLRGRDEPLSADRVVALPRLEVAEIPGLPQDSHGFIPTDPCGLVEGLEDVYAAGDATWFPIKQGGVATQHADAVAAHIAARLGAPVAAQPAALVLRAALLTGGAPEFFRADAGGRHSVATHGALWWPPGKIAGRYLAPLLARRTGDSLPAAPLADLPAGVGDDAAASQAAHEEALKLALAAADAEAGWGDYETALRWLNVAEQLNVALPAEYVERRSSWHAAGAG
jgi:sulfide:quinone oxidoreductase